MITYAKLGRLIGFDRVKIRFDPILIGITPRITLNDTLNRFYNISHILRGDTKEITFSFLDKYPKLPSNIRTLTDKEMIIATNYFVSKIGPRFDLYSCAENINNPEVHKNRCIDPEMFIKMGMKIDDIDEKDTTQRLLCKCYPSIDIGEYHSCKHGCSYCYSK